MKTITTDGNTAAAMASYAVNETAIIYPITPSSPMAEACDEWSNNGKTNIFGQRMNIVEMQSEAGAAGAVHGSLLGGSLTTTFTASQGLLLMIPNMYRIAGELLPCVFNVASRSVATHALNIFGDHSDIYACRQTGFSFVCSANVQACFDLGVISMITTLNSSLPVLHFFDGFRTSHEINKISVLDDDEIRSLIPMKKILEFKSRSLNSNAPAQFGTAQNPDVFFQNRQASEIYYQKVGTHFKEACALYEKLTKRRYAPFVYYGASNAQRIIVAMGSSTETLKKAIDHYNKDHSDKAGLIIVTLYRPFYAEDFLSVLPKSTRCITVLDRTKEGGSAGEPLYLDVCGVLREHNINLPVLSGIYGLGGKEFTPDHAMAVIKNNSTKGKTRFTVGINDDITHTSLPIEHVNITDTSTQCLFYGLGSDGTVSANKNSIKIIGEDTPLYAQGFFVYDSKKSGSVTISHLRFGKKPISSPYEIEKADFIACHNPRYIGKYDFLSKLKNSGTLLLNCAWTPEELPTKLPANFKQEILKRNIKLYIIDAVDIANQLGLKGKINTIMQSAFFRLSNILPYDEAVAAMKKAAEKSYGKAGEEVVKQNFAAIDAGGEKLIEIKPTYSWVNATSEITTTYTQEKDKFATAVMAPIANLAGNDLPASAFSPDGHIETDTARFEKRGIAPQVPCWLSQNCIQCNMCSFVCPHGAIKPVLIEENEKIPANLATIPATGEDKKKFRIQISPLDCTGCGNCVKVCPAKQKALELRDGDEQTKQEAQNYAKLAKHINHSNLNKFTVKGSQFEPQYFQFSGACAGCGETPYIKLVTQLFGENMIIANATGCSSIYGGSFPSCPYTRDNNGRGPAWANSLFEDNAEFGLGIRLALDSKKQQLSSLLTELNSLDTSLTPEISEWEKANDIDSSLIASVRLINKLSTIYKTAQTKEKKLIAQIIAQKNDLNDKTVWIIGGDGWAYDIGYGGLDHILASGKNVNILVLDSQVYSNTGGQASKATPTGAIAKFSEGGKELSKKNLGLMALSYPEVYVAQISLGANMAQALSAFKEANEYNGVSIVIAYANCINHGIDMTDSMNIEREAVASGFWPIFRRNPMTKKLTLDCPPPTLDYVEFAKKQRRFANLFKKSPDKATRLLEKAKQDSITLRNKLQKLSEE